MERVLEFYRRAYNPALPVVCMDETPRQLIRETRLPIPARPGQCERHDYEYQRCGVGNVFMATEPLAGIRITKVTERKTKLDWAAFLHDIARPYTEAEKITLVMDNLSTHSPGRCMKRILQSRRKRYGIASSSSTRPSTVAG